MNSLYKIALCQMSVTDDKGQNLRNMAGHVEEAARNGARIVCLPEIWNSPYDMKRLAGYAEPADGPSATLMGDLARRYEIYLIGGSIPEIGPAGEAEAPAAAAELAEAAATAANANKGGEPPRMYNTSLVFGPSGDVIAKHRKAHLFNVNIEKGIRFNESDFFMAGEGATAFETDFGTVGLAICFDLRFPEMFREMAGAGAHIVFLPASFNMTTGPAHWDTLIKARALDNQIYFAACSAARNLDASYISWGHSCVATPWGEYCACADARESIVYATIDVGYLNKIRRELPVGN